MKKLFLLAILLLPVLSIAQPRPKDVIEHSPILYPEGQWSWLGANARVTVPHGIGLYSSSRSEGDIYYDTNADSLYYFNGTSWCPIENRTRITMILDSLIAHNTKLSSLRALGLTSAWMDTVKDTQDSLRHHNTRISAATKTNADQDTSISNHRSAISSIHSTDANQDTSLSNHRTQITNGHVTDANQDTSLSNHRSAISVIHSTDANQDTALSNHRTRNSAFALSNANEDTALTNHRTQISNIHVKDANQDTTDTALNSKVSTLRGYFGDALGSSGTWQGETIILTAGETMIVGHVCYIKSDGKAWRADADSAATMPVMFIATTTTAANTKGTFLAKGRFRLDTWNLSIGAIIFASTTKGLITDSAPSGTGDQLEGLGVATATNEIMFTPYPILVEK